MVCVVIVFVFRAICTYSPSFKSPTFATFSSFVSSASCFFSFFLSSLDYVRFVHCKWYVMFYL